MKKMQRDSWSILLICQVTQNWDFDLKFKELWASPCSLFSHGFSSDGIGHGRGFAQAYLAGNLGSLKNHGPRLVAYYTVGEPKKKHAP